MGLRQIFKIIVITVAALSIGLLYFDHTYHDQKVYYKYNLNHCFFPGFYTKNITVSQDENLRFFQDDFKYIWLTVYNKSKHKLGGVRLNCSFEGYYQRIEEDGKFGDLRLLATEKPVKLPDIDTDGYAGIRLYTKADIDERDLERLNISYQGISIDPFEQESVTGGFYYWMLENQYLYELVIAPASYIIVFLIGLLFGNWKNISIDLKR